MTENTILLAADHAGFELKSALISYLHHKNLTVIDLGTGSADSVDYPDYGQKAAQALLAGQAPRGIVICGTGIGISIAANRFHGVRCALCHTPEFATLARLHNNANLLALSGRFTSADDAKKIVDAFLETDFEGGRHQNRLNKIDHPASC